MILGLFKPRTKAIGWNDDGANSKRAYGSYDEYLEHQKTKLTNINNLDKKHVKLLTALRERLDGNSAIHLGTTVLCLGARAGTECEAFIEKGAVAIGVDLNPGKDNRYVVSGDFHQLQYADGSFDCAYTNSLDHVFDLEAVIREVRRVLKPDGVFLADIVKGTKDQGGRVPGKFEALWWETNQIVIDKIIDMGFVAEVKLDFTSPWGGTHVMFKKV